MGDPMKLPGNPDTALVLLGQVRRWRMACLGLVILLAGMVGGAATTLLVLRYAGHKNPPSVEFVVTQMLDRLTDRLHLQPQQAAQLRPILQKRLQKLRGIREQGRLAIVGELELLNREVLQVLDESQKQLWREMHEPLVRQFRRGPRWRGLGPGRPSSSGLKLGGPNSPAANPTAPDANVVPHP